MSLPLVIRPEAYAEMDDASAWYERQRCGLGDEFLDALWETLDGIQERPTAHPDVGHNVRRAVTRRFPYSILYHIETDRIVVIAVYHGRRHPRGWLSRA